MEHELVDIKKSRVILRSEVNCVLLLSNSSYAFYLSILSYIHIISKSVNIRGAACMIIIVKEEEKNNLYFILPSQWSVVTIGRLREFTTCEVLQMRCRKKFKYS